MTSKQMTPDFRASFHSVDWAILALYFVFLVVVGFWKRKDTAEEYAIGGRSLGLPVFVATLVATWYGGILGQGEFVYDSGVVAWTTNGLPYYVFALLFAFFLARRVRGGAAHLYTIPDNLCADGRNNPAHSVRLAAALGDAGGDCLFCHLRLSRRLFVGRPGQRPAIPVDVCGLRHGGLLVSHKAWRCRAVDDAGPIAAETPDTARRLRRSLRRRLVLYRAGDAD